MHPDENFTVYSETSATIERYEIDEVPVMQGIVRFNSLAEAIRAGYQVYERTPQGYLVRTRTDAGFALAIVCLR